MTEELSIQIVQTRYDTNQPISEVTGRPPVAKRSYVFVGRTVEEREVELRQKETEVYSHSEVIDKSQITMQREIMEASVLESGLKIGQRLLIWLAVVVVFALAVAIVLRLRININR